MKILINGASGFVGQALTERLHKAGHTIIPLSRDLTNFESADAVINLAGEPIANERWSSEKKKRILESLVEGSKRLIHAIEGQPCVKPSVIISASAFGYYGDRGDEILDETSVAGTGFLSEVCQKWEMETVGQRLASTRQVVMRFGMVLGHGGALEKLLPIFKTGLGGRIGNGKQWMSWIHINDLIAMI